MTNPQSVSLPENPSIRALRTSVIISHCVGLFILIACIATSAIAGMNDPTGWAALGGVMLFLYIGVPAYLLELVLLVTFWVRIVLRRDTYHNEYSRLSRIMIWVGPILPWALLILPFIVEAMVPPRW